MSLRALGITIFGFGALLSAVLGFSEHDAAEKMPAYADPVMESRFSEFRNRSNGLMQPGDDAQNYMDYISAQGESIRLSSNAETQKRMHVESRNQYAGWLLFCVIMIVLFSLPWGDWLKTNEEIADDFHDAVGRIKVKVGDLMPDRSGAPIIGRDGLKSYSSADELLKWKRLLDEDVISQEEYDAAVGRIMRRN